MVTAPSRRNLVRYLIDGGLTERKSLRLVGRCPSSYGYRPPADPKVA